MRLAQPSGAASATVPSSRRRCAPTNEQPAGPPEKSSKQSLEADKGFLLKGDVFTEDFISSYLELKWEEVYALEHTPHPIEFKMYYSG